jgi:hypothetical protein
MGLLHSNLTHGDNSARANDALRDHMPSWEALGLMSPDLDARKRMLSELSEDSPAGKSRRAKFRSAMEQITHEYSGLGMEMNHRYNSGQFSRRMREHGRHSQKTPSSTMSL